MAFTLAFPPSLYSDPEKSRHRGMTLLDRSERMGRKGEEKKVLAIDHKLHFLRNSAIGCGCQLFLSDQRQRSLQVPRAVWVQMSRKRERTVSCNSRSLWSSSSCGPNSSQTRKSDVLRLQTSEEIDSFLDHENMKACLSGLRLYKRSLCGVQRDRTGND